MEATTCRCDLGRGGHVVCSIQQDVYVTSKAEFLFSTISCPPFFTSIYVYYMTVTSAWISVWVRFLLVWSVWRLRFCLSPWIWPVLITYWLLLQVWRSRCLSFFFFLFSGDFFSLARLKSLLGFEEFVHNSIEGAGYKASPIDSSVLWGRRRISRPARTALNSSPVCGCYVMLDARAQFASM